MVSDHVKPQLKQGTPCIWYIKFLYI